MMKQPFLKESGTFFNLSSTLEEMCLTAKHKRKVF